MNKDEGIKKYGKERCLKMYKFLNELHIYYDFPYSEELIYKLAEDLEKFTNEDLKTCLTALKERESTYRLKFNEIYIICKESKQIRVSREEWNNREPEKEKDRIPMPESFKKRFIDPILKNGS